MFSIPELISKKQSSDIFTTDEIQFFIDEILNGNVHDAQIGAFLMAVFLKGMVTEETVALTLSMMKSGDILTWPEEWKDLVVDKHSTGGVGDKVSLVLAPAIAACGLKIPMISGRSLGFTGGTLDKLESIPGFNINFSSQEMLQIVDNVGCCIVGQTAKLVPADKILYSIRDITSTVASKPLVTSSIISKKAAEGLTALVLDVKYGSGCYQNTIADAEVLAKLMVETSVGLGIKTSAVISSMDTPVGLMVGNSLEVLESIQCLQGNGPQDLMELVVAQGGELLFLKERVNSRKEGEERIMKVIKNGDALKKFQQMVIAQGVSVENAEKLCSDPKTILPLSENKTVLYAKESGFISNVNAQAFGEVSMDLGAGRKNLSDKITHHTGLVLAKPVWSGIEKGEAWVTVYHKDQSLPSRFVEKLESAVTFVEDGLKEVPSKVKQVIRATDKKLVFQCQ